MKKVINDQLVKIGEDKTFQMLGNAKQIASMLVPVTCSYCNQVYDLATVKFIHRFSDCDLFVSPCCENMVDNNPMKENKSYIEI